MKASRGARKSWQARHPGRDDGGCIAMIFIFAADCCNLGAFPSNHWSSGGESDSLRDHEQGFSRLEDR
jgi:hypothetical protein